MKLITVRCWQILGITGLLLLMKTSAIAHDKVVVVPLKSRGSDTLGGVQVVTSATGRIWMDRNLGAFRAAMNKVDLWAYGGLFQWGRLNDGHAYRASPTTTDTSNYDDPGVDSFVVGSRDWRTTPNDDLWQGVSGINNPCPTGFRLPTIGEWQEEVNSWSSQDAEGAFASPLKLVVGGTRYYNDGTINWVGSSGKYWSSTACNSELGRFSSFLGCGYGYASVSGARRAEGYSVRCIRD